MHATFRRIRPAVVLLALTASVTGLAMPADAHTVLGATTAGPGLTPQGPADAPGDPCRSAPSAGFVDTAGNAHGAAIDCVVWHGIALGTTERTYAPADTVTRAQMASFLARFVDAAGGRLPEGRSEFKDVAGSAHRDNIERLAAGGIVRGVGGDRYDPGAAVSRAQMATFLVRSYEFVHGAALPVASTAFTDIVGNTHEDNIRRAAGAGFARGRTPTTYAPAAHVRRDQMASFLARMLETDLSGPVVSARPDPVDPALAAHTVSRGTGTADCDGALSSVRPGDVVAIQSGDRGRLRIQNCHGTPDAPIVFVNDGGVVNITAPGSTYAALDIRDSSNLRVSGSGAPGGGGRAVGAAFPERSQDAGIRVSGAERGVAFKFLGVFNERFPRGGVVHQNLEIDHIEAGPTTKNGIHGPESDRLGSDYTVAGFRIHHNYVHRGATHECMYLGSGNYPDPYADTGAWEIDHNLCSHNGRDGIQLGNAWYGDNRIHHNVIRNVGQADNQDSFGIILRRGSTADVFNNFVFDSGRDGIRDHGIGGSRYFNNVVVRGGHFSASSTRGFRLSTSRDAAPAGHLVGNPGGARVWNNTIVGFGDGGIHFTNDADRGVNEARNNIMWNTGGGVSTSSGTDATISHNLTSDPHFVDPDRDDYRLRSGSPAIDAGHDLSGHVDHDITATPRPQGAGMDIGAYEYVE